MLTKNVFKSTRTLLLGLVLVSSMAVSACFVTPSVSTSSSVSSSSSESTSVSTSVSSVSSISVVTAQDLADDAAGSLLLSGITGVTADMSLPSAGKNAASITWASENTSVISIATTTNGVGVWVATVIRPMVDEGGTNVTVKLTATVSVTLEGVTATQTKEFSVFVLAVPASEVMTISQASVAADGTKIKIAEATVVHTQNDGFHIWDGVDTLFVYTGAAPTVAVNDVVQVIGEMDIYYGLPELAKGPAVTKLTDKTPVALPVAAVKTIAAINDEVSTTTGTYGDLVKITGVVTWDAATSLLKIYDGEEFLVVYAGGSSAVSTAAVTYIKDNFAGQKVTFDVWIKDFHSSGYWRVLTDADTAEEVTIAPLTDAEKVEITETYLTTLIPSEIYSDIALPATYSVGGTSVTIAWVSDTLANLSNAGVVTYPAEGNVTVKLTATIASGDEESVKEFSVVVGQPVITTIAAAIAATKGTKVAIQGIVVGNNTSAFYIKDATGILLVYKKLSDLSLAVGDEVILYAATDAYNGTPQLPSTVKVIRKISSGNELGLTATPLTVEELRAITVATFANFVGKYISIDVNVLMSGAYANAIGPTEAVTASQIQMYGADTVTTAALAEYAGHTITLQGFLYGNSKADLTGNWRIVVKSFVGNPPLPTIGTPANVVVNGTVVNWDAVTDAVSYNVEVLQGTTVTKTVNVLTPTIDISAQGLVSGSYTVRVVAVPPAGILKGVASTETSAIEFTAPEVGTPTNLALVNNVLTWDAVSGAASYSVELISGLTSVGTVSAPSNSLDLTTLGLVSATYTFRVLAVADSTHSPSIVYGELATQSITGVANLFISEYLEGASNNKAIEIYNPTGADVDLSNYSVALFVNGATTATYQFTMTGTLVAGDVVVIMNNQFDATLLSLGDVIQTYPNAVVTFNGDDAVVLYKKGIIIDSIGQLGVDPGSIWGTAGTLATGEFDLQRLDTATNRIDAKATYAPADYWTGIASTTSPNVNAGNLGTYKVTVTYVENGGSSVDDVTGLAFAALTVPTSLTKEGFVFGGWYTDEALTVAFTGTTLPVANTTLYAKWVA